MNSCGLKLHSTNELCEKQMIKFTDTKKCKDTEAV